MRVGIVILAAGASTRFGSPKQLLSYRGRSLVRHAAATAVASDLGPVVVVLGAHADRIAPELDGLPVEIAVNAEWEEGMASSLRTGVHALIDASQGEAPPDAVILMLCDQPLVTPEVLRAVAAAYRDIGRPAVASAYEPGVLGPPCLFAPSLFADLLALRGRQGAKQLLARLPEDAVATIPFTGGACDIDTAEDAERMEGIVNAGGGQPAGPCDADQSIV